jgi:hypothetical protein
MSLDFQGIFEKIAVYGACSLLGWIFSRWSKLLRDVDAAHQKIRELTEKVGK